MNRTLLIPLALAVAVATLIVCKPVTLDRTVSTLDDVESFINEYPDSALIVLNKVDSSHLITRALRAKYSLLRVMALDKCYEPIIKPGLLDHAVNWYGHRGSVDDRMKTLYYQGRVAQDNGDQKSAAIFYAQAEEYAESVNDKHALGLLYVAESSVFNSVYNYEKEKNYIEKALAVFREAGDPMYDSVLGDLAMVYHKTEDWQMADSLYSYGIAHSDSYPYAQSLYLSNYAQLLVQQPEKDPEKAIAMLKRKQSLSGSLTPREVGTYAYALTLNGQMSESESLRSRLESLTGPDRYDVLPWLRRMAVYNGDYPQAYSLQAEIHDRERGTIMETLNDSVAQALQEYYEQISERENERRLRLGFWALAIIVLLLSLAFSLLVRSSRMRAERDRLLSIRTELERDLHLQEARATIISDDFSSRLAQLRLQLRQERLERLRKSGHFGYLMWMGQKGRYSNAEIVKSLRKDVQAVCALEKGTHALKRRLDAELDGLCSRLSSDLGFSDGSSVERFLCYWLIDLKSDMVAELLNTSTNNVYVKTHRLEQKIRAIGKADYLALI